MAYPLWFFQHDDDLFPYKRISSHASVNDAIQSGFRIMKLLCGDYREDLYVFLENKELEIGGVPMTGIHIYNGNIPFGVFIQHGELIERPKIGPLTVEKGEFPYPLPITDN